jgi:coatomer protein complex subunit gamma
MDLEGLINDANRSIATLAITTLLKTGSESGVERLMKQITSFMSEIADDFKIVVVDAIRAMCLKFPQKHRLLMTFLANVLREEGGFPYKKAIVDTLLVIIARVPEAKEAGLSHLCEFIEDCEFTLLSTQILFLLGIEGPSTQEPSKYIRFIYNRVVLENATVRASAVSALAKFGISIAYLRPSITVLLQRCLYDNDDEVRDRAIFFVTLLRGLDSDATFAGKSAKALLEPLPVPLAALEASCRGYLAAPAEEPFGIDDVTIDAEMLARMAKADKAGEAGIGAQKRGRAEEEAAPAPAGGGGPGDGVREADLLSRMAEFVHVGPRFTSSKPVALSEVGTEYEVTCVKHVYASHIILAFSLNNTLEDQLLSSVIVQLDLAAVRGLALETHVPCAALPFGTPGTAYACLRRVDGVPTGSVPCTLKFVVKDVDPTAGPTGHSDEPGYDDEYQLEELEICAADFMKRVAVLDFRAAWEAIGNGCEVVETFSLSYGSIRAAMDAVIEFLGMAPCENSNQCPDDAAKLTVLLAGVFLGGMQVYAIVNLRSDSTKNVGMRLTVRSSSMTVSQFVASSVA